MGLTDIETKRDKVIAAARNLSDAGDDGINTSYCFGQLYDAIAALNAAERPDPWQLLERVGDSGARFDGVLFGDIKAALAWRKDNP